MRLSYRDGFLGFSLLLAVSAFAQEKKIKPQDLPPAVQKTVVEQTKGGTVRGFNEETENGRTTYELEMIMNGHTKDVQDLPPAVQKTVVEQTKGGTVRGFNEETENGRTTYELEMIMNGHTRSEERR